MQGLHLTADLHGCAATASAMSDAAALRVLCLDAVAAAGLRRVGDAFHRFVGGGVTGAVLLAESHLAVHTWPELGAVTLDVYVCNLGADNSGRARALLARLEAAFSPTGVQRREIQRGELGDPAAATPAAGAQASA
jgi:S-adenosylmethionine decarboxylase proenzyme